MKKKNSKKADLILSLLKRDSQMRIQINDSTERVQYLRGKILKLKRNNTKELKSVVLRFMREYGILFGKINTKNLKTVMEEEEERGGQTIIFKQYLNRVEIEDGSLRIHSNSKGVVDTIVSKLIDLPRILARPKVKLERAIEIAYKTTKCKEEPKKKPELKIINAGKSYRLCWKVELLETDRKVNQKFVSQLTHQHGGPHRWIVYIDAVTGKAIKYYDNLQTAGPVVGLGTGYYSGAGTIDVYDNDLTFQLRDITRVPAGGPEIRTDDEDGASPSEDSNNNWNNLGAAPRHNNQGAEVDAHRFSGEVVDYFQNIHGRNSFDGTGGLLRNIVHLGTNYNNGYWNGSTVNLGDGTGIAATGDDYLCSDDWLAHEWTHAYTENTCALVYLNESGALNESFSDVMAAFITGDWLVFEDTWLKASAPAWRNMIEPTNGGLWNVADPINSVLAGHQPSYYTDRYTGGLDNGGVHINSGIINHLFYLLTIGGTHLTSGVTVTGIGQSAAEQMLWRCMSVNLVGQPNATFLDFRIAMLDACLDLFPTDLNMLSQVKNAFHAVGIGPDVYVRDNLADDGTEPYGGSYLWASPDIINRKVSVASPSAAFSDLAVGNYWENVEFGQDNYIYVRVQNRGRSSGDAVVNVYFSAASTFGTPGSWIHIGSRLVTNIAPGTMKVSSELIFPSALIPSPGHYCMIAIISDPLDPAPDHTLISSVSDYLNYVRNTNNISYRNMDVEDLLPGLPGFYSTMIRNIGNSREYFDIDIDIKRFVPNAKVLVKVDRRFIGGAKVKGLKLIKRDKRNNIYELLIGPKYKRRRLFLGDFKNYYKQEYGFENVLIEKDFPIEIMYQIPDKIDFRQIRRLKEYEFSIRQLWKGQEIGAAGLRFRNKND